MDRHVVTIFLGRFLQVSLSLASVRFITTLLGPQEVGNLFLFYTVLSFFGLALINPVGVYMNRKLHAWTSENTVLDYFFIFNIYLTLLSLFSVIIVYVLHEQFAFGSMMALLPLIALTALSIYFTTWNQVIIPSLNLLHYQISFVFFSTLTPLLGLGCSLFLATYYASTAVSWLSGQLAANVLVTFVALLYFIKVTGNRFNRNNVRAQFSGESASSVLAFSAPLSITTFFMWIQYHGHRIIIEHISGVEYLGIIGLGLSISMSIAGIVETLQQQLYYPLFYRDINTSDPESRTRAWNDMAQVTLPIYLSLALFVSCLAPFLITVLASDIFFQSYPFIVYGAWIEFFRMTTTLLSTISHAELRTRFLLKAYLLGGVLSATGVYFASHHQYYRHLVPLVLAISGFITLSIMYRDMKSLMRFTLGLNTILRSFYRSLPFLSALLLYRYTANVFSSVMVLTIYSGYFLIAHYKLFSPLSVTDRKPSTNQ